MTRRPDLRPDARPQAETLLAAALAALAGVVAFAVSSEVFPYLSANHDEGVYLQQAAMLLDGRLQLSTPFPEAFRPWFFVVDGTELYAKYSPVAPAVFALGKLAGGFRLALAAVAAANAALVYALAAAAFDRRTGLLAVVALLGSPMFLLTSATFLSYAPTTAFTLSFAFAYVRAVRRDSLGYAALAGVAIGVAFFSRPYTAVLFALPFVAHALVELWRGWRDRPRFSRVVARYAAVSVPGLLFVGVALAYNWHLTGSPFVFPYQAFAPHDGLGFGHREILGYDRVYDLELALRANAQLLREYATDWTVAGWLGTALAGLGVAAFLGRALAGALSLSLDADDRLPDAELQALLVGVLASVVVGNVYFWGNLNVLADIADPNDGLISLFGPFYHFDTLLPVSAFAASAAVLLVRRFRALAATRLTRRQALAVTVAVVLAATPVFAAAEQSVVEPRIEANEALTDKYAAAYEPFEGRTFTNAFVFLPTPYGDWTNHPFQSLRNDPSLRGDVVYALDRAPAEDFALLDAYEGRQLYRYTYRGTWTAGARPHVDPALQPLAVRAGEKLRATTRVGVPEDALSVSIRVEAGGDSARYALNRSDFPETQTVNWTVAPEGLTASGPGVEPVGDRRTAPIRGGDEAVLTVTVVQPGGASFTYRQEATVERAGDRVRAVWPPKTRVCRLVTDCGREATYLGNSTLDGVHLETTVNATG